MSYAIKSRIWIERHGEILLGQGRAQLLEAIGKTGSLSAAAKSISMSYKKAWRLLDEMNKAADKPLVITAVGGKDGGGAQLTEQGEELVAAYATINRQCQEFLNSKLKELP